MYNPSPLAFVYPPSEECLRLSFHILFANQYVPPTIDAACLALTSLTDAIQVGLLSKLDTADLLITCQSSLTSMLGEEDCKLIKHVLLFLETALDHAFDQSPSLLAMYFVPLINLCGNLNNQIWETAVDTVLYIYLNNAKSSGACLRLLDSYLNCGDLRVRLGTSRIFEQALCKGIWREDETDRFINLINVTISGIYEAQLEQQGGVEEEPPLTALYFSAWCRIYKSCKRCKKLVSKVIFSLDKEKQLAVAIAEMCVPNEYQDAEQKRDSPIRIKYSRPAIPSYDCLARKMSLQRFCVDPYAQKIMKVTEAEIYVPTENNLEEEDFDDVEEVSVKTKPVWRRKPRKTDDADIREKMKSEMQQICLELKMNDVDECRIQALEKMLLKCLRTLVLEQKQPHNVKALGGSGQSQRIAMKQM